MAFVVGASLIGAVLAGVSAQMASQIFVPSNTIISEQPSEPESKVETVETKSAEPIQSENVEKSDVEYSKPIESVQAPEPSVESAPVDSQRQTVDLDLVSYWKFDDTLDDYMHGIRGVVDGTESYAEGKIGRAFDFKRTSITIPRSEELNSPSFSVTFWVNPNQLQIQGMMDKISDKWASGWRIFMNGNNGNVEFDASGEIANIATPPLAAGKWSFVAVTYDSGSKIAKVYLDGELSAQASGVDMQNNFANKVVMASIEEERLDGRLDDVRFYNIALHEIQIREIYEAMV